MENVKEILRNLDETRTPQGNEALSYIGNILSIAYFATPLIQIIQAYKSKLDKNDIPIILLVLIILNCLLWLINAFASDDLSAWIPLLISNGFGLVINLSILFLYLNLLLDGKLKQFLFYGAFTINVIIEISYFMFRFIILNGKESKDQETKQTEFHTIGFVATVFNLMMYSSTFINIRKMMQTRSSDKLPIITIGIGILCTIIFMIQGMIQYSYFNLKEESNQRMYAVETMVSNGISFLSLSIQAGIWIFYFNIGGRNINTMDETLVNAEVSTDNKLTY
jgi:hypothetical protein